MRHRLKDDRPSVRTEVPLSRAGQAKTDLAHVREMNRLEPRDLLGRKRRCRALAGRRVLSAKGRCQKQR